MIEAGTREQIKWGDGNWVFLDVGFSAIRPSCGLLIGAANPIRIQFGEATQRIVDYLRRAERPTQLVIEAPLSVAFNVKGNPVGRRFEREAIKGKTTTRYWHAGLGCAVMVAAMYLVRGIMDGAPAASVRLFEGFVSYKERGAKSDDRNDVLLLREVILDPARFADCILIEDDLKTDPGDEIVSAFRVCGLMGGVPPVIKRKKTDSIA
jgi:hypothetical protein